MYQIEKFDRKIRIKISASYEFMEKICLEVEKFSKERAFFHKNFAIQLCVREALTNAIRHGCKNNQQKSIDFIIEHKDQAIAISIEDEGEGFDWRKKETNTRHLQIHGRGRNIINIYSDSVEYNEKGNKISFLINNK